LRVMKVGELQFPKLAERKSLKCMKLRREKNM
jgi:hypothetical protein